MITVQQAKEVIEKMENSFSSHDFIQKYMDRLKIKKNGRTLSENVFGRMNEVQLWKKKEEL